MRFLVSVFAILFLSNCKTFWIDFREKEGVISSQYNSIITWYAQGEWSEVQPQPVLKDRYDFLDEVQVFTATGGCYSGYPGCTSNRDLLENPSERNSTYNFSAMILVIENILKMGLKPYIVTGNVPISYSTNPVIGVFGVNKSPPESYNQYYNYIQGFGNSLVSHFGISKVRSFRFGVLTEFNNFDWYTSEEDYLKLFDFTEAALSSVIDRNHLNIGAHACTQCFKNKGGWDPGHFIQHVAKGKNYHSGGIGTHITFLADSFYESEPGKPGDLSQFKENIEELISTAKKYGLNDLYYGIDEGRILSGPEGLPLLAREVGNSYQGSFDAFFFDKMVEFGVRYYSRWNVNSNGLFGEDNVDTVASNVARVVHSMNGFTKLKVLSFSKDEEEESSSRIINVVPASNEEEIRMIVYFHDSDFSSPKALGGEEEEKIRLRVSHIPWNKVNISVVRIDDQNAQYWPQWQKDIITYNITKFITTWSKWTSNPQNMLTEEWEKNIFLKRLPLYKKLAELNIVEKKQLEIKGGIIDLEYSLNPHSVMYLSMKK